MVYRIIWSTLVLQTYISNIKYLQKEWSQKEIDKFIAATERKLNLLKVQPGLGVLTNKRHSIRKTIILKRILLVYRFRKKKGEIELIMFFSTWQDPQKMKLS